MRLPLLLLAALAVPAAAQSDLADGAGVYVALDDVQLTFSEGGLEGVGAGGEVGWRFEDGFDVGLIGSYGRSRTGRGLESDVWTAGLTAGYTRPAPLGTVARLQAVASVGSTAITVTDGTSSTVSYSTTVADVSATLGRVVPLGGSFRVRPSAGLYARSEAVTSYLGSGRFAGLDPNDGADAGVQLEAPVTFRLFGADAAFVPSLRLSLTEPDGSVRSRSSAPTAGFRLNF